METLYLAIITILIVVGTCNTVLGTSQTCDKTVLPHNWPSSHIYVTDAGGNLPYMPLTYRAAIFHDDDEWNTSDQPRTSHVTLTIKDKYTGQQVFNQTQSLQMQPCSGPESVTWSFVPVQVSDYIATVSDDRGNVSMSFKSIPDSPLEQFKSGIKAEDVKCSDGLTLVIKRENGLPACITTDNLPKLVLRGWSVNPISHLLDKGYSTQEQQDRFFYDIMNLALLKNWSEYGWKFVGGNSIDVGKVHFSQLQLYLPPNSGSPKISCDKGWRADIAIDTRTLTVINATYPLAGDCANQTAYIYREMALEPKGPNESVPDVIPTPSNTTKIENSNFTVSYDITGGILDSAKYDKTRAALEIYLTANSNGDLVVTIPRQLLDSPQHIEPYQFFVMVDNYPVRYVQTPSASYNTLTIPFSSGAERIEISVSE